MHSVKISTNESSENIMIGPEHSDLWAFRVMPFKDETLLSWMLRIARVNMVSLSGILRKEFEFDLYYKDPEFTATTEIVRFFCEYTGVPESEIFSLVSTSQYQSNQVHEKKNLDEKAAQFQHETLVKTNLPIAKRNAHGSRFCPLCLTEDQDPYFRRQWRIGFIGACLKHKCLLEDRCPKCKEPLRPWILNWSYPITICFNCGFNLVKTEPIFLDPEDKNFRILQTLINASDSDIFDRLFPVMWFIVRICSLNDPVFENHPITTMERFSESWNESRKGISRRIILADPGLMYLVLGTAYLLLQEPGKFEQFLQKHHSNLNHFWTKTPFICEKCNCTFSSLYHLNEHQRTHSTERPYVCMDCKSTFKSQRSLNDHLRSHTGERPFVCEICGRSFSRNSYLIRHLRIHKGEKPHKCEICGAAFNEKKSLKEHIRVHTGERPFKCETCGNSYKSNKSLKYHVRTHTGEKPYACEYCGANFTALSTLIRHLRKHTHERPYKCEKCGRSFAISNTLKIHRRTHTGERPYICDQCNAAFTTSGHLKNHQRTHTGERPYTCDICGSTFARRFTLNCHLKTHSGLKPFVCDVCKQAFTQKSHLTRHIMRMHTKEKPYLCEYCGDCGSRHSQ